MPTVDGIGYGEFTALKIEHFSKIAKLHLLVTQAVLKKHVYYPQKYHYIDLTAGCGQTPNGLRGCAIEFVEQAESNEITMQSTTNFIECDQNNLDELKEALEIQKLKNDWQKTKWNFFCGNYKDVIPRLITKKTNDFGLIYVDHSGDKPDFDTLSYISKMRPRIEILIYLPTTNIKRIYRYTKTKLIDYIRTIPKDYWVVREPFRHDKHKWTFLLGSNGKNLFKDYEKINFYTAESEKGQKILRELNLTKDEIFEEDQPKLFEI